MPNPTPEPPDRRPVLYAALALVIFIAAAFLFWPRSDENQPRLALTPTNPQVAGQARTTPTESANRALDASSESSSGAQTESPEGAVRASRSDPPTSRLTENLQKAATEADRAVDGETAAAARAVPKDRDQAQPAARTEPATRPQTTTPPPPRPKAAATPRLQQPATAGDFRLWVGSFREEANAKRRVQDLAELGVRAEIVASRTEAGTVYRVQLGWFADRAAAKAYGDKLQEHGVRYWIDRR